MRRWTGGLMAAMLVVALVAVGSILTAGGPTQRPRHEIVSPPVPLAEVHGIPRRAPHARPFSGPTLKVAPDLDGPAISLPRSFLGLSMEYSEFRKLDRIPAGLARVFALLRVPGDGPVILRIGGHSADRTFWHQHDVGGDFTLTPHWFMLLRRLTLAAHLRLMLDLNLFAQSPAMASALAKYALATLPRHSIVAFEVGNEPDLYPRDEWFRIPSLGGAILKLPTVLGHFSPVRYAKEFDAYRNRMTPSEQRIPLAGPEVANPQRDRRWITQLVSRDRHSLGLLTVHRYPLSACDARRDIHYPTIARVLSPSSVAGLTASVEPAVLIARAAGIPMRLTEMNSVTCSGRRNVSNTFATALWAPDALFSLLQGGVGGVNVHVRSHSWNSAFAFSRRGLSPHPLLYGLLTFVRMLGPKAKLITSEQQGDPRGNIAIWAVRDQGRMVKLLALDKGGRPVRVVVHLPQALRATGTVQRLTAPGPRATRGVTLAGQQLNQDERWVGRRIQQRVTPRRGGYSMTLRPYSGAILSVRLPAHARRASHSRRATRSRWLKSRRAAGGHPRRTARRAPHRQAPRPGPLVAA